MSQFTTYSSRAMFGKDIFSQWRKTGNKNVVVNPIISMKDEIKSKEQIFCVPICNKWTNSKWSSQVTFILNTFYMRYFYYRTLFSYIIQTLSMYMYTHITFILQLLLLLYLYLFSKIFFFEFLMLDHFICLSHKYFSYEHLTFFLQTYDIFHKHLTCWSVHLSEKRSNFTLLNYKFHLFSLISW